MRVHLSFPTHMIQATVKNLNSRLFICDNIVLCFSGNKNDRAIKNYIPFQATYKAGYMNTSDKTLVFFFNQVADLLNEDIACSNALCNSVLKTFYPMELGFTDTLYAL